MATYIIFIPRGVGDLGRSAEDLHRTVKSSKFNFSMKAQSQKLYLVNDTNYVQYAILCI